MDAQPSAFYTANRSGMTVAFEKIPNEANDDNEKENSPSDEEENERISSFQYMEKPIHLREKNRIMFEKSDLTVDDVMTMVAGYSLCFGLLIAASKSLIQLLKICVDPTFHILNVSNYYFDTTYNPPDEKINFHYYCTNCYCQIFHSIKKQFQQMKVLCESCSTEYDITLSCDNSFLTLNLQYQIELLLGADNISSALIQNLMSSKSSARNKCDIHDGKLHEKYLTEYIYECFEL